MNFCKSPFRQLARPASMAVFATTLVLGPVAVGSTISYHLYHGIPADDVFTTPVLLSIAPGGQVAFESRLGYATESQIAHVQVSADSGVNWTDIYSQAGTTIEDPFIPTETTFTTRTLSLAPYVGESISLRFAYTYTGDGYYFPSSDDLAGWSVNDVRFTNAYEPQPWTVDFTGDFNGNGKADLLWRSNTTGEVSLWLMNGYSTQSAATIYNYGLDWRVVQTADFDRDGKLDLLWRDSATGAHAVWLMNGTSVKSSGTVSTPSADWTVLACGDYSGDGMADLLWRNDADGEIVIFAMNGTALLQSKAVLARGMGWTPVPVVVDVNGDGFDDILWTQDGTTRVAVWLMDDNLTVSGGGTIYDSTDPYALVNDLLGDFDNSGSTDLVWRNSTTGNTVIWLMNGTSVTGAASIYAGLEWAPLKTGDFNGDNKADLLWRTNTGYGFKYVVWLMNGTAVLPGSGTVSDYTYEWVVRHVADFNGDGRDDLFWRSDYTGAAAIWLMNGMSLTGAGSIY